MHQFWILTTQFRFRTIASESNFSKTWKNPLVQDGVIIDRSRNFDKIPMENIAQMVKYLNVRYAELKVAQLINPLVERMLTESSADQSSVAGWKRHLNSDSELEDNNNIGRIYLNQKSYKVENYIRIVKCYRCQKFRHIAKYCSVQEGSLTCGTCSSSEHKTIQCPHKNSPQNHRCRNSISAKFKNHLHTTNDKKCPIYQKKLNEYNDSIDFDG